VQRQARDCPSTARPPAVAAAACPATRPHTTAGRPTVIPAVRYALAAAAASLAGRRPAAPGRPHSVPPASTGHLTAPVS
jgi:hypothetical protein